MQDNFDKAFRDKLASYQAPADPQDWAAMGAVLDAQQEKRRGFFWWWIVALVLLVGTVGITLRLVEFGGQQGVAETTTSTFPTGNSGGMANTTPVTESEISNDRNIGLSELQQDNGTATTNDFNNDNGDNTIAKGGQINGTNTVNSSKTDSPKPQKNQVQGSKKNKNSTAATGVAISGNNVSNRNNSSSKNGGTSVSATSTLNGNGNAPNYDEPVGNLSLKQLRKLPSPTALTLAPSKDTSKLQFNSIKPKAVAHYFGLGAGWMTSRVDRSGDFRPGYGVGLQYTMMVKNRFGIHAGFSFKNYRYFTDLVACNYNLYQCPNSYSSSLKTVDLNVGVQVNLVKTEKVDWYVMGGISNQFMMSESFEYNLSVIDSPSLPSPPVEPPRNTSFTGPGSSGFEESISNSLDATGPAADPSGIVGKFLRERYLGAWYVGTGITYRFMPIMSLQVEPVIGRSMEFVGIQDKRLWNTGVNVRLNVRLGR